MVSRLSALTVSRLKEPGMYADGDGLYLQITGPHAKSWVFRYSLQGRPREMGLGSLRMTSSRMLGRKPGKWAPCATKALIL